MILHVRLIPAGAGYMVITVARDGSNPAHPRWRGAHSLPKNISVRDGGSSPLARGTSLVFFSVLLHGRLIPAGAGHIEDLKRREADLAAHPRWRGAHTTGVKTFLQKSGSSPLARGT